MPVKAAALAVLVAMVCACTNQHDPEPSPLFDGRYTGTRQSDDAIACGSTPTGNVTAQITTGHFRMPLFSPSSLLEGTVGEDGRVRASGLGAPLDRIIRK